MTYAEFLPDNINMMNNDGDVVAIDDELLISGASEPAVAAEYESPNLSVVRTIIEEAIETSIARGYRSVKVGNKPLGQFLAIDLFKYGLSTDELRAVIATYRERAQTPLDSIRALGASAVAFAENAYPDVRMLAANDDTFKD